MQNLNHRYYPVMDLLRAYCLFQQLAKPIRHRHLNRRFYLLDRYHQRLHHQQM
jgi:hypothetical protein